MRMPFVLWRIWREEFQNYSRTTLQRDVLAGITVAAVALPLALAFGVASGATAAAGMVTAIVAGVVIGGLGGAGYQISGPTGAMSAILIVVAGRYGLEGVWVAGLLAGLFILLMGLFDLGQVVNFIPAPVITGFTSGIAVIIFVGQLDKVVGQVAPPAENAFVALWYQIQNWQSPNLAALALSLVVILIMLFLPASINARFPASLLGLIVATFLVHTFALDVPTIGTIPQQLVLEERLRLNGFPFHLIPELLTPALSIAALGAIESLLCGTVAERMTGKKLVTNQELIAQGIGNILLPFFGGVPATAAIARTSVAIKSGAATRVVTLTHALTLFLATLLFAPLIAGIPLAALAGVLIVTAWRMNDWEELRDMVRRRFKSDIFAFGITLIATALFDLTQAIILGVGLSALLFVFQSSRVKIVLAPVSVEKMRSNGYEMQSVADGIVVVYIAGPLFFGTVNRFNRVLSQLKGRQDVILSLRTVPLLDTSGITALEKAIHALERNGQHVYLSGLNEPVEAYLERAGVLQALGAGQVFWSAFEAIVAADHRRATTI